MHALPEATARLLRAIDALPTANRLILVGGTALALRIAHRRSEDLDFIFIAAKLPRKLIADLLGELRKNHEVRPLPNVAEEQNFLNSGLELADYHQDYGVDGVKVSFFVPDPQSLGKEVHAENNVAGLKRIQVSDLRSLFVMKSATLNERIALRDYFDVYTLIERHQFSLADVLSVADRLGRSSDTLKLRLTNATRRPDDPGVELPTGAEVSFDDLKTYFTNAINRLEQDAAEKAFRSKTD